MELDEKRRGSIDFTTQLEKARNIGSGAEVRG